MMIPDQRPAWSRLRCGPGCSHLTQAEHAAERVDRLTHTVNDVALTRETVNRVLYQLGSFASLIETHPSMTSTTAAHIDALASTIRDEVAR